MGLFLMVIAGLGAFVLRHPGAVTANAQGKSGKSADKSDDEFFYSAIGQSGNTAPTDQNEGKVAATTLNAAKAGKGDSDLASFTLEFDVFHDRDDAEKLIDELRLKGIEAYFTPLSRDGRVVYRVRRGVFPTRKEADHAVFAVKDLGGPPAKVVKLQ